ncbi:MAG: sulfotransferase [Actinobacteria bacterium]|nr:sulfotransferase [Actinomycetota bacterium]MCB9388718.1 sulfotransferase [Acidimicrobiia bacterium]
MSPVDDLVAGPSSKGDDLKTLMVTVGTDHHPFDRIVRWAVEFAAARPGLEVVIQAGTSTVPATLPPNVVASAYLAFDDLRAAMDRATVIVTHGGPATIGDALEIGHRPVVMPRDPQRGEHVDGHQQRFAKFLAEHDQVDVALEVADLDAVLRARLEVPIRTARTTTTRTGVRELAVRSQEILDAVDAFDRRANVVPKVTVGYIGGLGRSGSTVLTMLLNRVPQVASVGELGHIWKRGLLDNELCECGEPFHQCLFWTAVGRLAFGGWDEIDPDEAYALQRRVDRNRYILNALAPRAWDRYRIDLAVYARRLARIYEAIAQVAGVSVVLDSTKHLSMAYVLRNVAAVDVRVVHLVRDPRGVAHSWQRQRQRPEIADRVEMMPTMSPARTSARWLGYNLGFDALARLGTPTMRLRYETFVEEPAASLQEVAEFVGFEIADVQTLLDAPSDLRVSTHSIGGNPVRFRQGPLHLRNDAQWKRSMADRDKRLVTFATAPLRPRYGYRNGDST